MPGVPFDTLPDGAWLWALHAERRLRSEEAQALRHGVEEFLERWSSHGALVRGGYELRDDQFLLIGADETAAPLSGCSKDGLVHALQALQEYIGVRIIDAPPVCFRDGADVRCVDREAFGSLALSGKVHAGTPVFDETVPTVGDVRRGRWATAAGDAWHARAFELPPRVKPGT